MAANSTHRVLIQWAVLKIQQIFHVELWRLETGSHYITTDKIKTPRWIMTPPVYSFIVLRAGISALTIHSLVLRSFLYIRFAVLDDRISITWEVSHSTLNCDSGSWFNVALWPRDMIKRWIKTWSQFHVELWTEFKIPRWIMTKSQDFTLNCDLKSIFHVE